VDNFIVRIRRVMEDDPHHPRWVHTIRSVGYQFDPEGRQRKGEE
jgi:DNA-binding response OmpR family regulator